MTEEKERRTKIEERNWGGAGDSRPYGDDFALRSSRFAPHTARALRLGALAIAMLASAPAGCERPSAPSPARASTTSQPGPRQTIERLIAAHRERRYGDMESLMLPGRATDAMSTLMAIDEFLLANRMLCDYVRQHVSPGVAQLIDQSPIAGNLDVFSPFVTLVDEDVRGDDAEVAFMVDGRLPLKRTRLKRIGGRWKYDPGEGYAVNLPDAFRRMADGLNFVLDGLKQGRPAADRILEKPDLLVDEVRIRLMPGVSMLKPPASQPIRQP